MQSSLTEDQDFGFVRIGRGTYWEPGLTDFKHYAVEPIIIGRYCSISARAVIQGGGEHDYKLISTWPFDNFLDGKTNPTRSYRVGRPTVIGSDVWIGLGALIKSGVNVGHGAVIGGGAVVSEDVPPYAVVAGNPATLRRFRFAPEQIAALLRVRWWEWTVEEIADRRELFYGDLDAFLERFDRPEA